MNCHVTEQFPPRHLIYSTRAINTSIHAVINRINGRHANIMTDVEQRWIL